MAETQVVFVLGGPGAGKGTQCANIVKDYGFVHLSAGDLLRAERNKGNDIGDLINTYIKEGKIVPIEITLRLLKNAMAAHAEKGSKKFLIDGFPRNQDNLDGWNSHMNDYAKVEFVLFLDCPEEVMQKRLLGRNEGRSDDNLESIKKRFKTYTMTSKPIIDTFSNQGLTRRVIADRTPEEVYGDIEKIFNYAFEKVKVDKKEESTEEKQDEASSKSEASSQDEDPKKRFSRSMDAAIKVAELEAQKDVESGEKEGEEKPKKKKVQFWDLSVEQQKNIIEKVCKETLFNPTPESDSTTKSAVWLVDTLHRLSFSGGYHATCTETKVTRKVVTHKCRVNSYGILEWVESPLCLPPKDLIPANNPNNPDNGGCLIM